ncbi:Holliday junction resolvase RuvX [Candidatus Saccharibacteria bacterium]|nr:Holliday junction resolvase RuvX [Candidatus Saccharibacteria bacterium]
MSSKISLEGDVLGLDLGKSRTGVARIHTVARIAEALLDINMAKDDLVKAVEIIVHELQACAVVAGLPRGLDGQETEQTRWAEKQVALLQEHLSVPVFAIDEAGTTKQAELQATEHESRDGVAAGILLEDFLREVERGRIANVSI